MADTNVGTNVTIGSGTTQPVLKCKWEQEPDNNIYDEAGVNLNLNNVNYLESGDTLHLDYPGQPGNDSHGWSQFNPPLMQNTQKLIEYYTVVKKLNNGTIGNVFALVFHPVGSPAPYGTYAGTVPSPGARGVDGSQAYLFKYKVSYAKVGNGQLGNPDYDSTVIATFNAAADAHLIKFIEQAGFTRAEVLDELQQGEANLYRGTGYLDFEQPANNYTVDCYAQANDGTLSASINNYFWYVPTCGIEVDFNSISFGNIGLNQEVSVGGDQVWGPSKATVRNIGNTWTHVTVAETDMAFGITGPGTAGTQYVRIGNGSTAPVPPATHGVAPADTSWNVYFDAQMGVSSLYKAYFTPNKNTTDVLQNVAVVLPNYLGLSMQDKLDFSIFVFEGAGTHTGTLTLGCQIQAFSPTGTPSGVASH
jgi:hypothetical protein